MRNFVKQKIREKHNRIRKRLHELETASKRSWPSIEMLDQFKRTLKSLFGSEEDVLYSKLEKFKDKEINQLVNRHEEEHRILLDFFEDLKSAIGDEDLWNSRLEIFKDMLEGSLRREDERLLKISDAVLNSDQRNLLLEQLEREEQDIFSSFELITPARHS